MNKNPADSLFSIIAELVQAKISHSLTVTREDAITILAVVPGERWEVDVFNYGEVELEVFRSDGTIYGCKDLANMIQKFSD